MIDNNYEVFSKILKPQRLVLARESRGLLQSELARKINITQGTLSKMESGLLEVPEESLDSLSNVLSYPKSFFYEFIERYPLGLNFYRKNKGLSNRIANAIQAFIDLRRNEIEKLLRSVEFSYERKIPFCDIEDEKYGSPEIIANSIRKFWELPRGPINNMVDLLESAGIIIIPCDFGTREFSGVGTWTSDGIKLIFINKQMPGDRMRFTLAHELGHIIMHRLTTELMEKEADKFASEFLMPSEDIRHQLAGLTLEKLAQLKLHWKVSMSSLLLKSHMLGITHDRQYSYLWSLMGKYGYRLNEPVQYNISQEKPSLLSEMITTHLQELGFSVNELASVLQLQEDEFKSVYGLKNNELVKPITKLRLITHNYDKK